MFLLNHVKPEDATGKVAEAYSAFPPQIPVPDPLVMMSVSPEIVHSQSKIVQHYMTHDKLDFGMLATIRYLVANEIGYQFCVKFNSGFLKNAGELSDDDLEKLKNDPESAPLEESQKAMVSFVLKVVKTPEEVKKEDVEKLREFGWSDRDIFDAAYHGVSMLVPNTLYTALTD